MFLGIIALWLRLNRLLLMTNMWLWSGSLWTVLFSMLMFMFFMLWPSLKKKKKRKRRWITHFKTENLREIKTKITNLVGTHSGLQHGLAKSYASRLTLSPLFCLSRCPKHGLHDRLWQWFRGFELQRVDSFWLSWFSTFSWEAFSSSCDILFVL